jgi:dipeptidyl aminopeptidase/acylaminoacyl peptidase
MILGFHYSGYYHGTYAMNQHMASKGYVVLAVNYRSGIGYGMEFREALNYGARGASEVYDVLGAGLYLRGRPDVDPGKIGLWGGSYGGFLTAQGLAQVSKTARVMRLRIFNRTSVWPPRAVGFETSTSRHTKGAFSNSK